MVLEPYHKRLRFFCMAMAIAVGVAVTWRYCLTASMTDAGIWRAFGLFWLTFYMTLTVATIFGTIYVKRIFPPKLEDYEEYSKQAHYTPL
jgi:heme/copper-type cytochrome/quinol oxidase subunit 2